MAMFTTSWDDGHPLDLRMADLLAKYGFAGTFYVPGRIPAGAACGAEGLPVLPGPSLRELGRTFEIGSHTLDHCDLMAVGIDEARRQVVEGKNWLENELGQRVPGFCYPKGGHSPAVRRVVRDAGFSYARTTNDLYRRVLADPYQMPVSFHFYPRPRSELLRRLVKGGAWHARARTAVAAMRGNDLLSCLQAALDHTCRTDGMFHLWGHSWELEKFGGWQILEAFLSYAAERVPQRSRMTNGQLAQDAKRASQRRFAWAVPLAAVATLGEPGILAEHLQRGSGQAPPLEERAGIEVTGYGADARGRKLRWAVSQ